MRMCASVLRFFPLFFFNLIFFYPFLLLYFTFCLFFALGVVIELVLIKVKPASLPDTVIVYLKDIRY